MSQEFAKKAFSWIPQKEIESYDDHVEMTLAVEFTEKSLSCFSVSFSKVIGNFIDISAGKNVDDG
ncbi:hypothetical protein [Nostoc sp. CHAB 5715]|uniref:hypothetical protein n=1 Tax=Nostoc sp. CHAB 5715 TaxID=2780400 RepID=UPI001E5CEBD3|nr:hypothetical protein [Nostoc sp. CHAB 5715]MCC5625662.1 hypothetical protein [Nostoc sp. CHAB 5715]